MAGQLSILTPAINEHWMSQAYELACTAALGDEVPVGALLVAGTEIVGVGANQRERTSRTVSHAEIMALEDFNRRYSQWRVPKGTSLFVTTEPCLMCTGALLWARVENIFFGCADPKNAGLLRILPSIRDGSYDHQFDEVQGGILAERCSSLMSGYFRKKRQRPATLNAGIPS